MSEQFLSRWSRLKRQDDAAPSKTDETLRQGELPAAQNVSEIDLHSAIIAAEQESGSFVNPEGLTENENPSLGLPAIDTLTAESDFSVFMQAKVPEALKRQALKKMFAAPHFNVMDGLDIYIDDYSVSTPIPLDWYDHIPSWQAMLNVKEALITDKGYAVEPDSEEGKAILAQRAERERMAASQTSTIPPDTAQPSLSENAHQNSRTATPLAVEADARAAISQQIVPQVSDAIPSPPNILRR